MLRSLTEHELLVFWVQLAALLLLARLLGGLMKRFGQPAVIGELAAGVLLGPSVFGELWPAGFEWFLPDSSAQSAALLAVGWIGVALLLLVTGFETDLRLIRSLGGAAFWVSTGSLLVPLALGLVLGFVVPAWFLGDEVGRALFAVFLATALSISSLPVIAKILSELGLMRRNFGQLTLAAGMANDVVGWLLLGIIAGLASSGEVSPTRVAVSVGGLLVFLAVAFTIGQVAVDALLRRSRQRGEARGPLTISVVVAFLCCVITQALGVEAVLGAFVAGIVLGRSRFQREDVVVHLDSVTQAIFAPIFFATAGLRVDLGALGDPSVLGWAVVVIVVASLSKFAGAYAGARIARLPQIEGVALGAGLNARGALEIVIATIGLGLGVLSTDAYTIVVLMAIATSAMAPPILRTLASRWQGSEDERGRLELEHSLSSNVVVRPRPLLLPSRGGPNSIAAAQILHFAWPVGQTATVLSVRGAGGEDVDTTPLENVFADRPVEVRSVDGDAVSAAILAEASLGYGIVGVGANDRPQGNRLVSEFVDDLLSATPVPVAIVRRARNLDRPLPGIFTRALVPVTGSPASRAAQEVAFNLSANLGTEVVLVHVVSREQVVPRVPFVVAAGAEPHAALTSIADRLLDDARDWGTRLGARIETVTRTGASAGDQIISAAADLDADLVVLGATVRRLAGRPFLGHAVEHVLADADPTVVVVSVPPAWG